MPTIWALDARWWAAGKRGSTSQSWSHRGLSATASRKKGPNITQKPGLVAIEPSREAIAGGWGAQRPEPAAGRRAIVADRGRARNLQRLEIKDEVADLRVV